MTRGSTAQSCSSGGLAHHGLAREPHAPSRRVRPAPVCGEPCVPVAPSSRRGAQGRGLLRGATQPDLPRAVRAAPGAAPAPEWVPDPQNGPSWGPTGSAIPRRVPREPSRMGVGRPHPGAPCEPKASVQFTGRWVCVTAPLCRRTVGLRHASCAGGGLRPCAARGGRADAAARATSGCLRAPARVHRPPRLSEPSSPRFAGSHGRHLLRSQQSPSGPAAGARAVVQPGPAPGHEETHVYAAVAEPRAFSAAGRGSDGDPRTRPGRSAPSAPTNRTEPFLHP